LTQFGVAVVYLLLSAKNIHDFMKSFFNANLGYCIIILIVAVALLPITFLKSPQDFW
jgi:vesicular inhibitory amino acid transporter